MTVQKLFIPTKIRIGFQNRTDTFTGKLAYIIYYDEKGKIRKEKSWEGWRDEKIDSIEFENTPRSGYILNKGVQRDGNWGSGRSVIRVHDPRDFEFEVSVDNLIGILMHSDVSKRDIIEECIFAWSGADLILLPTNSVDYQASVEYTNKQDLKVSAKELVKGRQYHKKKSDEILTYIGFFEWWDFKYESGPRYGRTDCDKKIHFNKGKKHIFHDGTGFAPYGAAVLSSAVNDDIVDNYADLVDNFYGTFNSQSIVKVAIKLGANNAKDTYERNYYEWPHMYTLNDQNILSYYSVNTGYRYNDEAQDFVQQMSATEYRKQIYPNYDDISVASSTLKSTALDYTYVWGDSNRTRRLSTTLIDFHYKLRSVAEQEGYDYTNLLPSQYANIMTKLGYGKPVYVLQNGREVDYREYY